MTSFVRSCVLSLPEDDKNLLLSVRHRELKKFADNRLLRMFQEPNGAAAKSEAASHALVWADNIGYRDVMSTRPEFATGLDICPPIAVRGLLNEVAVGRVERQLFYLFSATLA